VTSSIKDIFTGYKLPFTQIPPQREYKNKSFSHDEHANLEQSIQELIISGAVKPCKPVDGQFISPVFLVPKPNGSMRFILNLKKLNKYLVSEKFKLEDLRSACRIVEHNSFMASIDLRDAYFLVPIHKLHRKYLRFRYMDKLYEFSCLPFGISVAPRVFTKLLRPVVTHLRSLGYANIIYLDDILILGNTLNECLENINTTVSLLQG